MDAVVALELPDYVLPADYRSRIFGIEPDKHILFESMDGSQRDSEWPWPAGAAYRADKDQMQAHIEQARAYAAEAERHAYEAGLTYREKRAWNIRR